MQMKLMENVSQNLLYSANFLVCQIEVIALKCLIALYIVDSTLMTCVNGVNHHSSIFISQQKTKIVMCLSVILNEFKCTTMFLWYDSTT